MFTFYGLAIVTAYLKKALKLMNSFKKSSESHQHQASFICQVSHVCQTSVTNTKIKLAYSDYISQNAFLKYWKV